MKALVIHSSLNPAGGGEYVALQTIKALHEAGYEVTLATYEPTDWSHVMQIFYDTDRADDEESLLVRPDKEHILLPFRVNMFGIYMRQFAGLVEVLRREDYDIVINTHGDMSPTRADIIYVHFPMWRLLDEQPSNTKYSKSLFWRLYFAPYKHIQRWLARKSLHTAHLILVNSSYTRDALLKSHEARGIENRVRVLYPPVDVNSFGKLYNTPAGERRLVVACGRYAPEKRFSLIIEAAKRLPDIRFVIMGSVYNKLSESYYRSLARSAPDNVVLLRNTPRYMQQSIYRDGRVFVHAMEGEHFGIAIVEAMAAGMAPVVHMSGGAWSDIAKPAGGYGFRDASELAAKIEQAYNEYNDAIREHMYIFSQRFSSKRFRRDLIAYIEKVRRLKH